MLSALWIDVLIVHHRRRPAAWVTRDHVELYPHAAALESDHPDRRWVICTALFAMQLLAGHLTGEFTQMRADHFARCALIPDEEFAFVRDADDATLAEYFNVPLEQIAEKRLDVLALSFLEQAD